MANATLFPNPNLVVPQTLSIPGHDAQNAPWTRSATFTTLNSTIVTDTVNAAEYRCLRGQLTTGGYGRACDVAIQAIVDAGPSLYWPGNALFGARDLSGNSRNGAGGGGVTIGGYAGSPLPWETTSTDLDGSNDLITSGYAPFVNGTTRTLVGFHNRDADGTHCLVSSSIGAGAPELDIVPGGTVSFYPNQAATPTNWAVGWTSGVWVPWALVFDETANNASLYLNGVLISTQTETDAYNATPGNIQLGLTGPGTAPFNGKWAHFAVFERGLTATEIANIAAVTSHGLLAV